MSCQLRVQAVAAREDHFAGIKLFQFDIVALYSISIGEGAGEPRLPGRLASMQATAVLTGAHGRPYTHHLMSVSCTQQIHVMVMSCINDRLVGVCVWAGRALALPSCLGSMKDQLTVTAS